MGSLARTRLAMDFSRPECHYDCGDAVLGRALSGGCHCGPLHCIDKHSDHDNYRAKNRHSGRRISAWSDCGNFGELMRNFQAVFVPSNRRARDIMRARVKKLQIVDDCPVGWIEP